MRRRDFTRTILAAACALPGWRRPTTGRKGGMRFGCAAITWDGDDATAIAEIGAMGFQGIQLRTSAVRTWGKDPEVLRSLLAGHRLTLVALSSGTVGQPSVPDEAAIAEHLANARFLRAAGGKFLQLVDVRPVGRQPVADDFRRIGALLTEIGRRTADLGIPLGYHNHMGALGQSPDEVARVLDTSDPRFVHLELDIAHYAQAGGDPADAIRRYRDRLLFLHLKDVESPVPGGAPTSYRFVPLGGGRVDLPAVFRALDESRFDGWGVVELDSVKGLGQTARQANAQSAAHLRRIGHPISAATGGRGG